MKLDLITVFLYSYLIGSIPFGLIITKIFLKKDIRKTGSGNIGATNVLRTGKKLLAAFTLFLDISKGYVAVLVASIYFADLIYLAALVCFIGHIFPIWLNFRGGKGIATFLGTLLLISIEFTFIFALVWLVILFIFKYSSLASILSTFIVLVYSFTIDNLSLNFYLFTVLIIVVYTHRENIKRLKNKKENKIKF